MNAEFWIDGIRIECARCFGAGAVESVGPVSPSMTSPPYRSETCESCKGDGWVYTENCEACTARGFEDVLLAGICHEQALCIDCIVEARVSRGPDPKEEILPEWESDLEALIQLLRKMPTKPGVTRVEPAALPDRREASG